MNKNIQLFYIDKVEDTRIGQVKKIYEEYTEVMMALVNEDNDNLIEECWDIIQSTLGLIKVKGLEKEFKEGFKKHREKMLSREYKLEEM